MNLSSLLRGTNSDDLPWRATKVEGVSWLPLHLEAKAKSEQGDATVLIQMAPGSGYPGHRHVGPENVLVLAGGYRDEAGEYRAGDHVRYPAGSSHSPVALGDSGRAISESNPACVLYAVAQRGVELL